MYSENMMELKIYINSTDIELINKYKEHIQSHNNKILQDQYSDAGFDLFTPENMILKREKSFPQKIDYQLICSAKNMKTNRPSAFYMYPRSSISKTKLRLANNVGIIDSGYRGNLIGMFDLVHLTHLGEEVPINKFDRHLQICAPNLMPFLVTLVSKKEELDLNTSRGDGGFGSTGK